ncbi:MAG TPA: HAD family hydrolase [Candidatus Angelobacter sp.]|jgi:HAD superfamily hydrolase (TIGR01549 family)|nr:HAD family hydrolase [Candidatus Angelobacter sp.]
MAGLTAVIFDIDGTLTDSVDIHAMAWQEALRHFDHEVSYERVRRQIGKGGDQLLKTLLSPGDLKQQGEELEQFRGDLFKRKYMKLIKPLSMVPELFQRIREQGTRVVLASSAKQDEVDVYEKLLGIEKLVEHDTSSDDAERSKPHPDIFAAAMQKLGNPPAQQVVAIGDTPYDAQATAAISIACIGVLSGGWTEQELREAGCMTVFRGPADLFARFGESPLAQQKRAA